MATKAQLESELAKLKEKYTKLLNATTETNNEIARLKEVKSDNSIVKTLETALTMRDKRIEQLTRDNNKLETKLKKAQTENVELKNEICSKTQNETKQPNSRGAGRKKTELNMSVNELKQAIEKDGIDAVAKELGVSKRTIYRRLKE